MQFLFPNELNTNKLGGIYHFLPKCNGSAKLFWDSLHHNNILFILGRNCISVIRTLHP